MIIDFGDDMVSYVIGDEFFVASFMFGGIERGVVVSDKDEMAREIENVISGGDAQVIVVERRLALGLALVEEIKADEKMPFLADVDFSDGNAHAH